MATTPASVALTTTRSGADGRRVTDTGVPHGPAQPGADLARERVARGGAPRIVLVTGDGGAGVSTVAAATALAGGRLARRTLLLTRRQQGPEPPLGPVGDLTDPAPVTDAPGLWAATVDPGHLLPRWAALLQRRGRAVLELLGADALAAEEVTELPGVPEAALWTALRQAADHTPPWDLVVVDLPPTDQAVQLLALPERLRRYLRRLLPPERRAARALRPLLAQLTGAPMPAAGLYEQAARLERELTTLGTLTASGGTTVRLVVEPGPRGAHTLRRARAWLALLGLPLDAVVANRVLPPGPAGSWAADLAERQREALGELHATPRAHPGPRSGAVAGSAPCTAGHPVPRCPLPHLGLAVTGAEALGALADRLIPGLAGWTDEAAGEPWSVDDRLADEGRLRWRLPLPGAVREEVELLRRGGELIVDVAGFRRILPLPSALRRCTVEGARLADDVLTVRFRPDPALWPRSVPL